MITYPQYLSLAAKIGGYWSKGLQDRWLYLSAAGAEAERLNPRTALEVGTNGISLLPYSDTLDHGLAQADNPGRDLYGFDASKTPWPLEDDRYDLVVACQVLEHLGPDQPAVFREMSRVGRHVILTLPYRWHCPGDLHNGIDDDMVAKWTCQKTPFVRREIGEKPYVRLLLGFSGNK